MNKSAQIKQGLRENAVQFSLLVIANAFVGAMIGIERTIMPQIAEEEFSIAAKTAVLSFITVFGISKAITNYFTGSLANKFGRRNLLIAGWILGLPVPFVLMYANSWNWIIATNVLLGIHQGLTWSSTVVMKIDLVGERQRGLAMGLNEFAGYLAVALVAMATGYIAGEYGIRPYPFYIGIIVVTAGLLLTLFFIRDTVHHVAAEESTSSAPRLKNVFLDTTWRNPNLGSVTQAGLVNNLNDGMVWGLLPVILIAKDYSLTQTGMVTAIYPAVWGIGQLFTGKMSDIICKKDMMFLGMFMQGLVLLFLPIASTLPHFIVIAALLGFGTAMVYPVFLASVADNTHPRDRAASLGVFRFWRDSGYAVGAILTGLIADYAGADASVIAVGVLTLLSSGIILYRMKCLDKYSVKILTWLSNMTRKR